MTRRQYAVCTQGASGVWWPYAPATFDRVCAEGQRDCLAAKYPGVEYRVCAAGEWLPVGGDLS